MKFRIFALLLLPLSLVACKKNDPVADPVLSTTDFRFSVSATQKVRLATSNIQYCPATRQWRFAENAYDTVGTANRNVSSSYNGWIDLFAWGSGDNPCRVTSSSDAFSDWGSQLGDGWRTLSSDEWDYLLNRRPNASALRAKGSVRRLPGFILLPDGWHRPLSVTFAPVPDSSENDYTLKDWNKMAEAGAIFLPAAGRRSGYDVMNVALRGYYWTASPCNSDSAVCLYFVDYSINPRYNYLRSSGAAVRLAKNE